MLSAKENEYITRTGPGTPMGNFFRRFWIPALLSEELPAPDCPPVRVRLLGEDLVAFKDGEGKIGLLDAHCPHRLADLFFGRNEECGLRCVYHGWKFDVEGNCVDMPNEPAESNFKHKIRTTAYPCKEQGGVIWAYMGPKDVMPDFPQMEWALVPDSHRIIGKALVECNYFQAMEGEIDNSHVSYLHSVLNAEQVGTSALGVATGAGQSMVQYQMMDKNPRGFVKQTDYGVMMGWRRNGGPEHYHWRVNQWLMPFTSLISGPPGATQIAVTRPPRDDETSWAFLVHWNATRPLTVEERAAFASGQGFIPDVDPKTFRPLHNKDNNFLQDRSLQRSYSFTGIGGSLYNQDLAVTVSMGPIVDRTKEHLGTADIVCIAVRRRLAALAKQLEQGTPPYPTLHPDVYRVRAVEGLLPRGVPFDEGFQEQVLAAMTAR
jgi:phenylpropionate dioxygenase-like ring-hydroxylating dioxygenase large terminal subunit